ncbi:MAG: phosphate ABC transporter permease subunit PstC [Christensenellales bacterium]
MIGAKVTDKIMKGVFAVAAAICIAAVIMIIVFLFSEGIPAISKIGLSEFLFGDNWLPDAEDTYSGEVNGKYGILTMIVGSVFSTFGALVIGGVLGYFTAVFLSSFCPRKLKKALYQLVNLLAGIPSVVYGFFGMRVLLPFLGIFASNGSGAGLAAVSLILGIMILPTVVSVSATGIEAVPKSYYEGARALGATHSEAVFNVVVPAAKSSVAASVILGAGRAIGETMAVIMVAGNNTVFPSGLFSSFRTLTANVVLEMGYAGELQMGALIGTGCVLFVFILIINSLLGLISGKTGSRGGKLNFPGSDKVKKYMCYVSAAVAVAALFSIVAFILVNGLPNITWEFLTGEFEYGGQPTIFPSIVATLMLIVISLLIAVPVGVFAAIYLNEYTKKGNKFVMLVRKAVEILSGIPSIVFGLFGMLLFSKVMGLGTSILAGALTLTVMIIPVIVRTTEETLKAVPSGFREGSFALGAGKFRTVSRVVLPTALPGILSAVLLSTGRIVSESAPLMFTMGASLKATPTGITSSGTSLAVALYVLSGEGLYLKEAYATACILIILSFTLNVVSSFVAEKLNRRFSGK